MYKSRCTVVLNKDETHSLSLSPPTSFQLRRELDGGGVRDTVGESGGGRPTPGEHWPRPPGLPELPRPHLPHSESGPRGETPHFRSVSLTDWENVPQYSLRLI